MLDLSRCTLHTPCRKCDEIDEFSPACVVHNKRVVYSCLVATNTTKTQLMYEPCSATSGDLTAHFVIFQLFCLVLGIVSLVWVKKESGKHLTEFERRKRDRVQLRLPGGGGGG